MAFFAKTVLAVAASVIFISMKPFIGVGFPRIRSKHDFFKDPLSQLDGIMAVVVAQVVE